MLREYMADSGKEHVIDTVISVTFPYYIIKQ